MADTALLVIDVQVGMFAPTTQCTKAMSCLPVCVSCLRKRGRALFPSSTVSRGASDLGIP